MAINKQLREQVWNKYNQHCAYCGCIIEHKDIQADHLIPQRSGGSNNIDNLMPSCRQCNHYKRANTLEAFRHLIETITDKLNRGNYIYRIVC